MDDYDEEQSEDVRELELTVKQMGKFVRQVETYERKRPEIKSVGVFKIIPDRRWSSNQANFKDVNHHFMIQKQRLEPCVDHDIDDCFVLVTTDGQETTTQGFQALAMKEGRQPDPRERGYETVRRRWDQTAHHAALPVISGSVLGSRFANAAEGVDFRNLKSVLELALVHNGRRRNIHGVTTPRIDFGSYRSVTALRTGYMGLYTAAYNHAGKPRVWDVVHTNPANVRRLETALKDSFRNDFIERGLGRCTNPLQHMDKQTQRPLWAVKNSFFDRHNIEYSTVVQDVGEIIVILPKAYFTSFDLGYNLIETVSFATHRWIRIGKTRYEKMCRCRQVMLNPEDLDAAKVEYDQRRQAEDKNAELTSQLRELQTEIDELRRNDGVRSMRPRLPATNGNNGAPLSSAPMAKRPRLGN